MARIGVTGHTRLCADTATLVYTALVADLSAYRGTRLRGVTCLAAGADQLFARAILACGGTYEVVVPATDYPDTIAVPADRRAFDELLARAAAVDWMPSPRSDRAAYRAASDELLRRVDALIAVWDGEPSRALGDTADVVAAARHRGLPVRIVWPAGARRE